jgi:hexulose-6-phosphate isomerase
LEGDNDWPAVMKAVDDIGYHGWTIAEQAGMLPGRRADEDAFP